MSLHFQFDARDHRIFSVFASGHLVNDEKQEALTKLVDDHPEWSNSQMADALLRANAKFGPDQKEALLARFPVKDLEPILGKIEMERFQFSFRGNTQGPQYAIMNWSVRFKATSGDTHDRYDVSLEPFDGKVIILGRSPGD